MTKPVESVAERKPRRPMDGEVRSMAAIVSILDKLDIQDGEEAVDRVLTYIGRRYAKPAKFLANTPAAAEAEEPPY